MTSKHIEHVNPYTQQSETMLPMGRVKFLRTFIPWQLFRFVVVNIKMTLLILKSHK
jgi:hypothetical protein